MRSLLLFILVSFTGFAFAKECKSPIKKVTAYSGGKELKELSHDYPESIDLVFKFKKCFKKKSLKLSVTSKIKEAPVYEEKERDNFTGKDIVIGYDLGPSKVNEVYTNKKEAKGLINNNSLTIKKVPLANLYADKKSKGKIHFTNFIYSVQVDKQKIELDIKGHEPIP